MYTKPRALSKLPSGRVSAKPRFELIAILAELRKIRVDGVLMCKPDVECFQFALPADFRECPNCIAMYIAVLLLAQDANENPRIAIVADLFQQAQHRLTDEPPRAVERGIAWEHRVGRGQPLNQK